MAQSQKRKPSARQHNGSKTQRDNSRQPPVFTPVGMATSHPPRPPLPQNKTPWPLILVAATAVLLLVFFLALAGSDAAGIAPPSSGLVAKTATAPAGTALAAKQGALATQANKPTSAPSGPQATATLSSAIGRTPSAINQPTTPTSPKALSPAQPTTLPGGLDVEIQGAGYEKWGKPTNQSFCGDFDDNQPVLKFTVPMRVKNNSSKTLSDWYATFYLANGSKAFRTCYYGYASGASFPAIPPGGWVDVTFAAFVEMQDRDKIARVDVAGEGLSARRCFSGQTVIACP